MPPSSGRTGITSGWLLRALVATIGVAAVFAYLSVCLLVYQGAWQFILHPSRAPGPTPTSLNIPFENVAFDAGATGTPRLTGWWIPGASVSSPTILFLHDGQGSLSGNLGFLALLHQTALNVFAVDYRGFGSSDPQRPNQGRMTDDSTAALNYLTETRHIDTSLIIPYGNGLGAVLAVQVALAHPGLPAVILDNPDLHTVASLIGDSRARLLPMKLLVRDRFELKGPLSDLQRPRLLIVGGPADYRPLFDRSVTAYFKALPDPKWTLELPAPASPSSSPVASCLTCPPSAYVAAVVRFVDTYVPHPSPALAPAAGIPKDKP